ncbi:unnamed protein product [Protopolystoma xenopodis]|uniref:Uncharacterized protein n=1 Tax=Protopolystoma xenopodis TaxID=117903 RepID=A0A448XIQ1_9PLAT|nr:unnamed protein product [Protopolystoma xenopodis]
MVSNKTRFRWSPAQNAKLHIRYPDSSTPIVLSIPVPSIGQAGQSVGAITPPCTLQTAPNSHTSTLSQALHPVTTSGLASSSSPTASGVCSPAPANLGFLASGLTCLSNNSSSASTMVSRLSRLSSAKASATSSSSTLASATSASAPPFCLSSPPLYHASSSSTSSASTTNQSALSRTSLQHHQSLGSRGGRDTVSPSLRQAAFWSPAGQTRQPATPAVQQQPQLHPGAHHYRRPSIRRMSFSPCTTMATQMKVVSGGDGYEEFPKRSLRPGESVSDDVGQADSTNHLLIWDVH